MKRIPREVKSAYPMTGTGTRQGKRIARQVRRSFGDPFAASNACLARIAQRLSKAESTN